MAKKKQRKRGVEANQDDALPSAPPAPAIGTGIGALLTRAGLDKAGPPVKQKPRAQKKAAPLAVARPAPRPALDSALGPGELSALNAAYRGVQPIKRKQPGRVRKAATPPLPLSVVDPEDRAARERLSALVGGGVRFEVRWDNGFCEGVRRGVSEKQLRRLSGAGFAPEATLDLHGMRREQAQSAAQDFVRASQRRGVRYVLVIVGKGLHSDDGRGVLAEALVEAITHGLAAPRVAAFASAAERHGGRGAIAIELG